MSQGKREGRDPDIRVMGLLEWANVVAGLLASAGLFILVSMRLNLPEISSAPLAVIILIWAVVCGSKSGGYWVGEKEIIFRGPFSRIVIPLAGLALYAGTGKLGCALSCRWKWAGEQRWLPSPIDFGGAWVNAFSFFEDLRTKGVNVEGKGFGERPLGDSEKVLTPVDHNPLASFLAHGAPYLLLLYLLLEPDPVFPSWLGLVIPGYVIALSSLPKLRMSLDALASVVGIGSRVIWTRQSVRLEKGHATMWELPTSDLAAILIEKRKNWAGLLKVRVSLVTHYGRVFVMTPWTRRLADAELGLIELARGAGLEVRIEGRSGGVLEFSAQVSHLEQSEEVVKVRRQ